MTEQEKEEIKNKKWERAKNSIKNSWKKSLREPVLSDEWYRNEMRKQMEKQFKIFAFGYACAKCGKQLFGNDGIVNEQKLNEYDQEARILWNEYLKILCEDES